MQTVVIDDITGSLLGEATVTSCINNGGIFNGCDQIPLNQPTAYNSIVLNDSVVCDATEATTTITVGTDFGDVNTQAIYTRQ